METQEKKILHDLLNGKKITPIDALHNYGCFRLGGRIYDLKQKGHRIITKMVCVGDKRFAQYQLIKK